MLGHKVDSLTKLLTLERQSFVTNRKKTAGVINNLTKQLDSVVYDLKVLKIKNEIKLERMAILSEFRGKNYGKSAILQLAEYYRMTGYSKMILDSILSVKDFYKQCGFIEEGEIFKRVGIDHIRMSLKF